MLTKLLKTGECDFDILQAGTRLQTMAFNSRTCMDTKLYYYGFVGEITYGRWAIAIEKRYLWGCHLYWICDMATTYKIIFYTCPIHTLMKWSQELHGYYFLCIHRCHKMMVDMNYLSRMYDNLVKQHVIVENILSLADRCNQPYEYKAAT